MSSLSVLSLPRSSFSALSAKTPADFPAQGHLVEEFDIWREGYAAATIYVYRAGTTEIAPLFTDIDLTLEADNPQILISRTDSDGRSFGKFNSPLYCPYAYQCEVNGEEITGQQLLPITSLAGQDGSNALVTATGSTKARSLKDRAADIIYAEDYGVIGASSSENTETIAAAIAAASSRGGGIVILPGGEITFSTMNIPSNVFVYGQGSEVTILKSLTADKVVTLTAAPSGLGKLQLDGTILNEGSIGIYSKNLTEPVLDDVYVRRFDTGILHQGGTNHIYRNLRVRNCNKNIRCLGDSDASGTGTGSRFTGMYWHGGDCKESTSVGLEMAVVDLENIHNTISQVDFVENIGDDGAILMYGTRFIHMTGVYFEDNAYDIKVADNPDTALGFNTVVGVYMTGGEFTGDSTITFDGLCQDIIFDRVEFSGTTFACNVPTNQIVLRDCVESLTLITGDSTKISRSATIYDSVIAGATSNSTATTAYKIKLEPNEVVEVKVFATAEQTNGTGKASWEKTHTFTGAAATLNYDAQTVNFTLGRQIQGATSGATGYIVADSDSGTTGTLSLAVVKGTFVDNEIITEVGGTGSARTNGILVRGAAGSLGSTTATRSVGNATGSPPSGWDLTFAVSGEEGLVQITGATSADVSWALRIFVTRL